MMNKSCFLFVLTLAVLGIEGNACQAEILPPDGPGQIGYRAEILCDSLTVRQQPGEDFEAVKTLHYGDFLLIDNNQSGAWVKCYLGDSADGDPAGWVNSEFISIDPARYRTDDITPVYAWNDMTAPKVAQLSVDVTLPILKDEGEWLLVSLHGAVGWIHKNAADRINSGMAERIRMISDLEKAELTTPGGTYLLSDENGLKWIEENFSIAEPFEGSGCPFDATLTLFSKDGSVITLSVATDSCHTFRTEDGSYFYYGNEEEAISQNGGTYIIAETFWRLFGLSTSYEDIYS